MLTQQLLVREAIPTDRNQMLQINRQTWQTSYSHIFSPTEIVKLFRNVIHQHGSWVYRRDERLGTLVAELDGEVIGFIGMASILNETSAEITTFYILPEYHGQGIGKQLWQTAIYHLVDSGYDGAWVWVLEKAEARHFYERRGCVVREQGIYSIGHHKETAFGYWLDL